MDIAFTNLRFSHTLVFPFLEGARFSWLPEKKVLEVST